MPWPRSGATSSPPLPPPSASAARYPSRSAPAPGGTLAIHGPRGGARVAPVGGGVARDTVHPAVVDGRRRELVAGADRPGAARGQDATGRAGVVRPQLSVLLAAGVGGEVRHPDQRRAGGRPVGRHDGGAGPVAERVTDRKSVV